jgi:glycerol-3-phosphate O-acyltransferase
MGAYFIRRRDRGALYRRVLARYVQLATAGGVTQAIFPEGRLSLDGRLGEPRLGLLSYIVEGAPDRARDVIFVPTALNYDRVLEDRFLVKAGVTGVRRFRPPLRQVLAGLAQHAWQRVTRRFHGFGTAKVALGSPLSLHAFLAQRHEHPTEALAAELMARVREAMPVVPVPLVARHLLDGVPRTPEVLEAAIRADLAHLGVKGLGQPGRSAAKIVEDALGLLAERGVITVGPDGIARKPGEADLFAYYASSIAHHFATAERT